MLTWINLRCAQHCPKCLIYDDFSQHYEVGAIQTSEEISDSLQTIKLSHRMIKKLLQDYAVGRTAQL